MNTGIRPFSGPPYPVSPQFLGSAPDFELIATIDNVGQIVFKAGDVLLVDADRQPLVVNVPQVELNCATVSGLGGIDSSAGTHTSAWHYLWIISDGYHVNGIMSLSSTAPVLPRGYVYRHMVGAVFNLETVSGYTWRDSRARGRAFGIVDTNLFTNKRASNPNEYQPLSGADLTLFNQLIPPIAKSVRGTAGSSGGSNGHIKVCGNGLGVGATNFKGGLDSPVFNGFNWAAGFEVLVESFSPQLYWASLTTSVDNRVNISGFTI